MKFSRRDFLQTAMAVSFAYPSFSLHTNHSYQRVGGTVRVGLIGHTGRGDYGHGLDTLWKQIPNCEIVGVADADSQGLKAALNRLKVGKGFADYNEMLGELKPEIVCIAPRHADQHAKMAMAALQNGASGIYMEKPFCTTLKEADELIMLSEKTGAKIALAHRNRYHPVLATLQKLLEAGEIGEIVEVRARGKEDNRSGMQDLWVLGSHILNLVPLFTGKLIACSAGIYQDGVPATRAHLRAGDEGIGTIAGNELHARFESEKGIPVYFDSTRDMKKPQGYFGFRIIGRKGVIEVDMDKEPLVYIQYGDPLYAIKLKGEWLPVSSAGINKPEPVSIKTEVQGHLTGVNDLLEAIRENRQPLCSAYEGRAILEAISAISESHVQGGKRVTMPLPNNLNPLDFL